VDLSAAVDRRGVVSSVAGATGMPMRAGDDGSALALQLADLKGVLVLDTCERVRAEVRKLAESLLRSGACLSLLATSRQPLGASTELVWPVSPLCSSL
jgi:predicted ATPase